MSITTYGLADIKKELHHLPDIRLAELCLRLARYKKENKELLAYLLFEINDGHGFIEKIKGEVGFMFSQLPSQSYLAAKSIRKILRLITKYTKFIGEKPAEIELLNNFIDNYIRYTDRRLSYKPLRMILVRQAEKTKTLIAKLHEDLQYDYSQEYNKLMEAADEKFQWFYKASYLM